MQHFDYIKVPKYVLKDDNLNLEEFKLLIILFSKTNKTDFLKKNVWKININKNKLNKDLIKSLNDKGWLDEESGFLYLKIPERYININIDKNNEISGSKIVKKWNELFGTLNLTPTLLRKILSFMEDGITEEVIIEVMKTSAKKTKGNPGNYIISILRDYLDRSIYNIYDFKEEKQRMEEYEKRLQEINRKKEKRDEEKTLEDYYKKGYR